MQLSKIGSKNTYHKCIKELHETKYIYYHPAPNKFQVVRISVIRLDNEPETKTKYHQLDLFVSPSPSGEGFRVRSSTDFDTGNVPNMGRISTDFDTVPVSKMGHLINQTLKTENSVLHTPTEIFKRNKKLSQKINDLGGVSNPEHRYEDKSSPEGGGLRRGPTMNDVEAFFQEHKYPIEEAKKFFLYNQGKNWMLTGKMPITNWQSIAHKWMLNSSGTSKQVVTKSDHLEVQYLYDSFLEDKSIFKHITTEHFRQLHLQLTDEILNAAWQQRIKQLEGTNQHSLNELCQAYQTYNPENELVKRDRPKFISLAKRIAVMNHFNQSKSRNIQQLSIPP